jgi:hypothetical protein
VSLGGAGFMDGSWQEYECAFASVGNAALPTVRVKLEAASAVRCRLQQPVAYADCAIFCRAPNATAWGGALGADPPYGVALAVHLLRNGFVVPRASVHVLLSGPPLSIGGGGNTMQGMGARNTASVGGIVAGGGAVGGGGAGGSSVAAVHYNLPRRPVAAGFTMSARLWLADSMLHETTAGPSGKGGGSADGGSGAGDDEGAAPCRFVVLAVHSGRSSAASATDLAEDKEAAAAGFDDAGGGMGWGGRSVCGAAARCRPLAFARWSCQGSGSRRRKRTALRPRGQRWSCGSSRSRRRRRRSALAPRGRR